MDRSASKNKQTSRRTLSKRDQNDEHHEHHHQHPAEPQGQQQQKQEEEQQQPHHQQQQQQHLHPPQQQRQQQQKRRHHLQQEQQQHQQRDEQQQEQQQSRQEQQKQQQQQQAEKQQSQQQLEQNPQLPELLQQNEQQQLHPSHQQQKQQKQQQQQQKPQPEPTPQHSERLQQLQDEGTYERKGEKLKESGVAKSSVKGSHNAESERIFPPSVQIPDPVQLDQNTMSKTKIAGRNKTRARLENIFEEPHKRVLRQCYVPMVEGIDRPDDVVDRLYQHDLLSFTEARDLKELPNISEKNRAIINSVQRRGTRGYLLFKQCLKDTGHDTMEVILTHSEKHPLQAGEWYCSLGCRTTRPPVEQHEERDHKWEYTKSVIHRGLYDLSHRAMIRENDGKGLMTMWKLDMLEFYRRKHPKYLILGHILLTDISGFQTMRVAHDMVWNRTVNITGGKHRNIPMDLANEFLNREFKGDDSWYIRPPTSKLRLISSDSKPVYDEAFIKRKVAEARVRLQHHSEECTNLGVSNRTRLSQMIVDKVHTKNMVILTGKPGIGKSFQGLNTMQLLLEDSTELPLVLSDPNEIEKALDPTKQYVIFIDDMFGGIAARESELKKWDSYLKVLESLVHLRKIKVIITMRKAVLTKYRRRFKSFHEECIVNLDEELMRGEKAGILKLYQERQGITIADAEAKYIVDEISDDTGIGFPLICKLMQNKRFPKAKSIETMKDLFLHALEEGNTIFIVLVMTLLGNDRLDISSLSEDENGCFCEVKDHCHSMKITKATLMQEANAYRGTYLKEVDGCFSFVHDTVIEATFLVAFEVLPDILFKFCPAEILTKCMNNSLKTTEKQSYQSQLIKIATRFASIIRGSKSSKDLSCILESYIWEDTDFIKLIMNYLTDDDFYGADENGKLTIHYLIRYGKQEIVTLLVKQKQITDKMIIEAIDGGHLPILQFLYEQRGKPPIQDTESGDTLLHIACRKEDMIVIKYLVKCHRNMLTTANKEGYSAGHIAAAYGHLHTLQYLLDEGINTTSSNGVTVLHVAANNGKIHIVMYLLEHFKTIIKVLDNDGWGAGHYAACYGDVECLKYLLASGLSPMLTAQDGATLLHVAAMNARIDVVKYLCDNYSTLIKVTDNDEWSAGHYAAQGGDVECLKYLLASGLSPMLTTDDGATLLHIAAANARIDVVKYLCDNYSTLIKVTDNNRWSTGHDAAQCGDVECLKYLLTSGLSPMLTTDDGATLLHIAAANARIDVVKYLCDNYSTLIKVTANKEWSVGHYAARGGDVECLKYILASGLSPMLTKDDGATLLHIAAKYARIDVVKYLCDNYNTLIKVTDNKGWSAGHYAAQDGDVECLKYLLVSGLSPMVTNGDGDTLLHVAASNARLDVVKYLCDNHSTLIKVTDNNGWSAGHYAAQGDDVECLKYILVSGLSPMVTNGDGDTLLHVAASNARLDVVKYLCNNHSTLIKVTDNNGWSAGHYAAQGDDVECLKYILASGLSPLLTKDDGVTLLHIAAANARMDIVKYLCDSYSTLIRLTDDKEWSAGHCAARGGDIECLKYILASGLSPMLTTDDGATLLHIAALHACIDVVKYLCDSYSTLIEVRDNKGWTAGHYAAQDGDVECLKYLLVSGLSPMVTNGDGDTILHVAASNARLDVVKYLCDNHSTLIKVTDNNGWSAGHYPSQGGDVECLKYLLTSGLSPLLTKDDGATLLHIAAANARMDIVKYLCDSYSTLIRLTDDKGWSAGHRAAQGGDIECLKYILASGLSPMLTTDDGSTLLHIAATKARIDVVKYLCDNYSTLINVTDNNGRSAGHYAAQEGDVECLKYLLTSGLSPMLTTDDGYTLLHIAADNGRIDVLKYMCHKYKSLIILENNDGKTVLQLAVEQNHTECAQYLNSI